MTTRIEEWAQRVTRSILHEWCGAEGAIGAEAATAVLEREVRVFVNELCGNRDAFLDASSPVQQGEPPRACEAWCGTERDEPGLINYCTSECGRAERPLNPAAMCWPWCGAPHLPKDGPQPCRETGCHQKDGRHFCTPTCRDAGKPLHPRKP